MNKVEVTAHNWLSRHTGFSTDQIIFRRNKTPDFVTPNGKGWEVKTQKNNKITLQDIQWFDLLKPEVSMLVFAPNEQEPRYTIPMSQLDFGAPKWKGLTIVTSLVTFSPTMVWFSMDKEARMAIVRETLYPVWLARENGNWRIADRNKAVEDYHNIRAIQEYANQHPDYAHEEIAKYFGLSRSRITQILGKSEKEVK